MDTYPLVRAALFKLAPESAHELTLRALTVLSPLAPQAPVVAHERAVSVMGLTFPNRVGLAAGLDKNAVAIDGLASLGFGFVEVGTVTPRAQPGNPRPRLFRLTDERAIINRMGFNNDGVDALVRHVAARRTRTILGINIGKNAATPMESAVDDYLACFDKVHAHASYVTINISSPNTKNLRQLQGGDDLDLLLGKLKARQSRLTDDHGRYVPFALKIAPDLDDVQIVDIADRLRKHQVDAVIATNTTTSRQGVESSGHSAEAGGLSGAPLRERATDVVAKLARALGNELPIIGVGGIFSGADALEKIQAGASLVQIYTGLIYRGPTLVTECRRALAHAE